MGCVVAAAVTPVDAAQEGDVALGLVAVTQDNELLVVRAPGPHAHVEHALAAGGVDLLAQMPVLLRREGQAVPVGAPYQPTNVDTAPGRVREHRANLGVRRSSSPRG